jgi:hypothetical protein
MRFSPTFATAGASLVYAIAKRIAVPHPSRSLIAQSVGSAQQGPCPVLAAFFCGKGGKQCASESFPQTSAAPRVIMES